MKRILPLLLAPVLAHAASNIDPAVGNSHAYGANIGWINCRGDVTNGAVIGEFTCSGFIYSANCGWIHLGDGTPTNGVRYQNNSATDFGVNVQDYFANGTNCEAKLLGYAYGANVGWIALAETGVNVVTTSIAPGADTDADTIPDNWERFFTGGVDLTQLTLTGDRDGDGESDVEEYAADTNPFSPLDRLQITSFVAPRQIGGVGPVVSDLTWTSKPSRKYSIEISPDLFTAFAPAVSDIAPDLGPTTFERFNDPSTAKKFYKVRAAVPLAP